MQTLLPFLKCFKIQAFTICSSVYLHFIKSSIQIFQALKEDGYPWFSMRLYTMERAKHEIAGQSEIVHVIYTDPKTNERDAEFFGMGVVVDNGTGIPIVPHSWYHVCMGLDTVSGLLRIVVNGKEVVNMEKEYFRNTKDWKSSSVKGKVLGTVYALFKDTFDYHLNCQCSKATGEDSGIRTGTPSPT